MVRYYILLYSKVLCHWLVTICTFLSLFSTILCYYSLSQNDLHGSNKTLVVERKYKITYSVSSISPCLWDHRSAMFYELLSSCNYKSSGSDLRYHFASIYSSSPLLCSFVLQCCCNLVKRNRSHKSRSGLLGL